MSHEEGIQKAVQTVEKHVEEMYRFHYRDALRPPPVDLFKASAMVEIGRRLSSRAHTIEEDWIHFTRD